MEFVNLHEDTAIDFRSGCLMLIDKPLDWTSFDAVNKLRYALKSIYGKIKVGHAGTLDPKASGLLLICTGKYTKKIDLLSAKDKVYTGSIKLGATTPSFDTETKENLHFNTSELNLEKIRECSQQFSGKIEQFPPLFSAIKMGGEALYKKARKGEAVDLKARPVEIKSFEILDYVEPVAHFRVHCSKGTYIRSLANDLGKELNNGAYLVGLRRLKVGEYDVEKALSPDEAVTLINEKARIQDESSR